MPEPPEIEFVDSDGGTTLGEHLDTGSAPVHPPRWAIAVAIGVLVAAVTVIRTGRSDPTSPHPPGRSTTPALSAVAASPLPLVTVPPDPADQVAPGPITAAAAAACSTVARCAVTGDAGLARAARQALGPVLDLQVRSVQPSRGAIVSSLSPSGARLLVLVTAPSVRIDIARLRIHPPFGVQSQHNGRSNVIAVASGSAASVALLSSPAVQHWLERIRLNG